MKKISALTLILLSILMGLNPAGAHGESLYELEVRWRELRAGMPEMSREQRLGAATAFFSTIPWDRIMSYCGEGASAGPDLGEFIFGLVDGKLRSGDWQAADLAAIISDPDMASSCQSAIVKHIYTHREAIAETDAAPVLAQAFITLADSDSRSLNHGRQLELGAANLWGGGGILSRMLRYSRGDEKEIVRHGIRMFCETTAPEPMDSLAVITRELAEHRRYPRALGRALIGLSECCGATYFDLFLEMLETSGEDLQLRRDALKAMGRSGDPRSYALLVDEYKDSETGIVDATHAIEDRDLRSFYWNLWLATRLAEPGMIDLLDGDGDHAEEAIELLDRASRFGLADTREEILTAMERWAARRGSLWPERVATIADRFRSFPETRQRSDDGGDRP